MGREAMRWVVPGRALDLGSGAGRVALHLQEQGHEVVAIDVSPGAVEVCRRRGVKDVRRLSITQVGPALGVFDTLLMLGNNWGLMASRARARWLLRRFHRLTAPGARILAASNDHYQTESPYHYLMVSGDEMALITAGTAWRVLRFLDAAVPASVRGPWRRWIARVRANGSVQQRDLSGRGICDGLL